jgi:hypothetical protein
MTILGDASDTSAKDLEGFYEFLYGHREGYVYAATKEKGDDNQLSWKQHFFAWPFQKADLIDFTELYRSHRDVYVGPALYSDKQATKECILGADVVWVELDDPPKNADKLPPPTCRIASGGDGHEHWYWKLSTVLDRTNLDLVNEALAYYLEADLSGWDSTQVLRPPNTFNHKRKRETYQLFRSDAVLDVALFQTIPAPPPKSEGAMPEFIPPVETVLAKYVWPKAALELFQTVDPHDRSDALMALGYHCAEMGMSRQEIFSVVLDADERWKKFYHRSDRMKRIADLVAVAVRKYPNHGQAQIAQADIPMVNVTPMGFKTLLATEVNLEWQWDGLLQRGGYFLLTGPTQVGKTQFSLNAAGRMALGQPFLGRQTKPSRIGFFSLEMGLTDLKHFVGQQAFSFKPEEHEVLEENLQLFPLGEPLYFTHPAIQTMLDQIVGDLKLDGIMVDSLGSATDETVSDETIKRFFHWNDQFKKRHNIFTWYIHHHRKANGDNKKPNKIGDVYGSQYITSYATTVMCLWPSGVDNVIQSIPLKVRLAPVVKPFYVSRDSRLHFVITQANGENSLPTGSPLLGPNAGSALTTHPIPTGVAGGHQAAVTGAWSMGPSTMAELGGAPTPAPAEDKSDETPINLSFGGLK